jgi:hypothetical protein
MSVSKLRYNQRRSWWLLNASTETLGNLREFLTTGIRFIIVGAQSNMVRGRASLTGVVRGGASSVFSSIPLSSEMSSLRLVPLRLSRRCSFRNTYRPLHESERNISGNTDTYPDTVFDVSSQPLVSWESATSITTCRRDRPLQFCGWNMPTNRMACLKYFFAYCWHGKNKRNFLVLPMRQNA